jgi:O-antigen/teichoic acid export membrane protein
VTTAAAGRPAAPAPLSGGLLRRQVVQYAPAVLLPALVSIVSAAVFTRVFDSAEYGRFSLASSVAAVAVLLLSQWLHQGVARFVPSVGDDPDAAHRLKSAVTLALVLVAGTTLLAGAAVSVGAAVLLPSPWPRHVLAATAFVAASVLFGPVGAVIQSEMRARRYSAYVATAAVLRLLFSVGIVFGIARDPSALLWAQAAALAVVLPLLWRDAMLPRLRETLRRRREWFPEVRSIAAYGFPVVGFTVSATLLDLSDRWVIQYFHGEGAVGIYAANYSLVFGTIGLVALPMLLATHPFLMRAWESGDRAAAGRWLGRIVEWYLVAGTLLVGTVGLYASDIANVMLGPAFRPGHRIIPVVLAGMIVWQLGMYSHKPLEFTRRTGVMFALCVAVTLANFLANLAVVPRLGYMGAAWTSLAAYAAYTVVVTIIGRRILPWRVRWGSTLGSLALTAAGLGAAALVRGAVSERFGYLPALGASALVCALVAAAVLGRELLPLLAASRSPGMATPDA